MTLSDIAKQILKDRKGVLSFDQSDEELSAEFIEHGIPATDEMKRAYRELVLSGEEFSAYISGVTMSESLLRDSHSSFGLFTEYVKSKNILVGVEIGMPLSDADVVAGLPARLIEYHASGVLFAEWRTPISVFALPASDTLKQILRSRIEFAKICQTKNILPVIEIDILSEGAHSATQAEDSITETLSLLSDLLESGGVDLRGVVVKTAMAVSGISAPERAGAKEVAERTVRAITGSLPKTLGGVAFLSGLQTPEEAAQNLNWIARHEPFSWPVAFSFGSALLSPALSVWGGKDDNRAEAQAAFFERLTLVQSADGGGYSEGMEESSLQKL